MFRQICQDPIHDLDGSSDFQTLGEVDRQSSPDVQLEGEDGEEVPLSSFWNDRPSVLIFLRHFG